MGMKKMTRAMAAAWVATGLVGAMPAHAGWSSGGGEIHLDSKNSWFVKNARSFTYCVEVDETNFGVDRERLREIAKEGWAFWKKATPTGMADNVIGAGTQTAVEEASCKDDTDVRLQFGVLSDAQRGQLRDPTRFAAIAVRTNYDPINLRGRGFIYVSPQHGALHFKQPGAHAAPWSFGKNEAVLLTLAHEMGHVFGQDHGAGIMLHTIPEMTTKFPVVYQGAKLDPSLYSPFRFGSGSTPFCEEHSLSARRKERSLPARFLALPASTNCFLLSIDRNGFRVEATQGISEAPGELLGQAHFDSPSLERVQGAFSQLYLTDAQRVFDMSRLQGTGFNTLGGPGSRQDTFRGTYVSADGKVTRRVTARLNPGGKFELGGVFEDDFQPDIFLQEWNPDFSRAKREPSR